MSLTIDDLMKAAALLGKPVTTTTTTTVTESPSLTVEEIMAVKQSLEYPVWYTASPHVEKGKQYRLPESEFNPEYWVVHTDDEMTFCDVVRRFGNGRIARHVREWQPKIRMSSFLFKPGS